VKSQLFDIAYEFRRKEITEICRDAVVDGRRRWRKRKIGVEPLAKSRRGKYRPDGIEHVLTWLVKLLSEGLAECLQGFANVKIQTG